MGRRAHAVGPPVYAGHSQLSASLPYALDRALREYARCREESLSAIVVAAITDYLRQHGNPVVRAMLDGTL